ncbi:DEAD/DEAH box helicase [Corynebacterium tapiri]|nr:DEAD/DEAH box helicase family protein [Corynebacterium tapiri]
MPLNVTVDDNLLAEIEAKFDLRKPNAEALRTVVENLEEGNFNPLEPLTLALATGAGKTYIMAGLIEYLRRQGHPNVMVVTPNRVVQDKTIMDLSQGSHRYVGGFDVAPQLITPEDVAHLRMEDSSKHLFAGQEASTVYVFNVQQLFPPKEGGKNEATGMEAQRRKFHRFQESSGVLAEKIQSFDDLVVIVDEAHLFGTSAKTFRKSLTGLKPAATIGLTASPDKNDNVIHSYPLWRALNDGFVKRPVLVYRKSGYNEKDMGQERQLHDAYSLLKVKEEAYAKYREAHPEAPRTKPLLFVVCQDVNHATETAEYLRNTHFRPGNEPEPQVLQVDNQHNDETTLNFLRYLDTPHSPVRVIVSVNKLREGWDTKRIAVMSTLRAMGSEVLTQQIMGRGLRLPFGKRTGVKAVDELDILSHKSFVTLLKSENVLREFGIEEENEAETGIAFVDPDRVSTADNDITFDSPGTNSPESVTSSGIAPTPRDDVDVFKTGTTNSPLEVRPVKDDDEIEDVAPHYEPVYIEVNAEFAGETFMFPSSTMTRTVKPFALDQIEGTEIVEAAKKVTDQLVKLEREAIVTGDDGQSLKAARQTRSSVASFTQSETQVRKALLNAVANTGTIQLNEENIRQLNKRIIPVLMASANINSWTEASKTSAAAEITKLVKLKARQAAASNTFTETVIHPVEIPVTTKYPLPDGMKIHDLLDTREASTKKAAGFVENRFYGTWERGLFNAAKFDSFSAEYMLADLLNFDDEVKWWTRIYRSDRASIAYTPMSDYVPDFVVLDTQGTYWIIEGKGDDKKDDKIVEKKMDAANQLLRKLINYQEFEGQKWGYVLAFESDIKAVNSFSALRSRASKEVMEY